MPTVTIEVRKPYSREEEALIDAVHAALVECLKTPDWDKTIRLIVHQPHRFVAPPGKDERYTLVDIDLFSGPSLDAKRALYRAIVTNLGRYEIPADQKQVLKSRSTRSACI